LFECDDGCVEREREREREQEREEEEEKAMPIFVLAVVRSSAPSMGCASNTARSDKLDTPRSARLICCSKAV
jgi:hypothetical protein